MNCPRYYSGGAQTRQDFEGESPEMGEEGLVNDISSEGVDINLLDNHGKRRMTAFDVAAMIVPELKQQQMYYAFKGCGSCSIAAQTRLF